MAWTEPKDWTPGEVVTAQDFDTHIKDNFNAVLPLGAFILVTRPYSAVETALEGRWLQCNGVAVSRTTYATLFNLFNTFSPVLPFGAGDGSTTFNLPDLRGRMPIGQGTHADVDTVGDNDGTALASRTPKHKHTTFNSLGGSGTTPAAYISRLATFADYGALLVGPQTNTPTDTPAFVVVGSWFIKYRS